MMQKSEMGAGEAGRGRGKDEFSRVG